MSDQLQESCEQVSALVDGQLRGEAFARTVAHLASSADARATWDTYHLVGEVMRSSGAPTRAHDPAFVAKLRARLAEEAIAKTTVSTLSDKSEEQAPLGKPAANDGWWKQVVGLASVAVVGVLAWQGVVLLGSNTPNNAQLAQVSVPTVTAASSPASAPVTLLTADGTSALMIRDPQLDALMAAHRQMGGATALQMPSGFLRNATFNEGKR